MQGGEASVTSAEMTRRITIVAACGLAGLGLLLLFRSMDSDRAAAAEKPVASIAPAPEEVPDAPVVLPRREPIKRPKLNAFTEPAPEFAPEFQLGDEALAWERRIDVITAAAGLTDAVKARLLLEMLPGLPEEALDAATREAMERLPDRDHGIAQTRLLDPQTHGMVLSVLFADLLERPDVVALPALLTLAKVPAHPFAHEARVNLELLTSQHFGRNWSQWEAEVQRRIGKEPAPAPQ